MQDCGADKTSNDLTTHVYYPEEPVEEAFGLWSGALRDVITVRDPYQWSSHSVNDCTDYYYGDNESVSRHDRGTAWIIILDCWKYLGAHEAKVAEATQDETLIGAKLFP